MSVSRITLVAACAVLAACTSRGAFTAAPADLGTAETEAIFVGTTREADELGFGFGRADSMSFFRYEISIPSDREPGELSWPPASRSPDPEQDFLTAQELAFATPDGFRSALAKDLRQKRLTSAVVYVHGFNTNMAEGVYRFAQMHHDLEVPAVAVHYSWPSRGSALGYLHDRDSAAFARSGLEDLLDEVAAAGATEIVVVAHSMGAALTMETLRQVALSRNMRVLNNISGVVLISPDIDVDVFRSQARDMGKLPQPFVVFGSSGDRILGVSATIAGAPERLGNLSDITRLTGLGVTYLDTAAFSTGSGHMNLATSPALISLIGGVVGMEEAFSRDEKSRVGLLPAIVLTVRGATEVVLAPVAAIGEGGEQ